MPDPYDHDQLVQEARRYLVDTLSCGFAFAEMHADAGEVPDAIGWKNASSTVLIECKTNRSDFHSGLKKPHRQNPSVGVGLFRLYMAPTGLLEPEDLPPKWGLIEVDVYDGQLRSIRKHGPSGPLRKWTSQPEWMHSHRHKQGEKEMLYSALRRFEIRGLIPEVTGPSDG